MVQIYIKLFLLHYVKTVRNIVSVLNDSCRGKQPPETDIEGRECQIQKKFGRRE